VCLQLDGEAGATTVETRLDGAGGHLQGRGGLVHAHADDVARDNGRASRSSAGRSVDAITISSIGSAVRLRRSSTS
jgi:hypothetical protein